MYRSLCVLLLTLPAVHAQNVPGYGWSSLGVLPFGGYDMNIMKAPNQYVLYYHAHPQNTPNEGPQDPVQRAISTDLKTWTVDTRDLCASSP